MADVASHYQRVAEAWRLLMGDDLHLGFFDRGDEPLAVATEALTDELASFGGLKPGEHVLDVGCGLGASAMRLQRVFGCEVTGITVTQRELDLARALNPGEGHRLLKADFMDTVPPEGDFDVIWLLESSHLFQDKVALMAQARRALGPAGGRVILCDVMLHEPLGPRHKVAYALGRLILRPSRLLSLRRAFGRGRLTSLEALTRAMEASGLSAITTRDISAAVLPTLALWRENLSRHRAEVERLLGRRGWLDFGLASELLEDLMRQGIVGYGMIAGRIASPV